VGGFLVPLSIKAAGKKDMAPMAATNTTPTIMNMAKRQKVDRLAKKQIPLRGLFPRRLKISCFH
jgi:hypothetical protein